MVAVGTSLAAFPEARARRVAAVAAPVSGRSPIPWQVVLGSSSPARLGLLRAAGIDPRVVVADVDEDSIAQGWDQSDAAGLVQELADAKSAAVLDRVQPVTTPTIVITADSLFRFDGEVLGKPGTAQTARIRLSRLSGRAGHLLTGHTVAVMRSSDAPVVARAVAATEVRFAEFDDRELAAYIATGEPLNVAGGFTLDGLAAPLIQGITGDPSNVIGLSLPLLRQLVQDLGVFWPDLWQLTD